MRDRDVRAAIQQALIDTGAFDLGGVWLWGLPEDYGTGTSIVAACSIQPVSSTQDDRWDGGDETGMVVTSLISLTLFYRNEDPQARDEGLELLLDTTANALNGRSLAGLTLPDLTRLTTWAWQPPTPPERQVKINISYQYILDGWSDYDVTP